MLISSILICGSRPGGSPATKELIEAIVLGLEVLMPCPPMRLIAAMFGPKKAKSDSLESA
jgi:hypothetical protein